MQSKRVVLVMLLAASVIWVSISCGDKETTYKKPESFIVDPETGEYYVSNVNGVAADKDQNGFICKLNENLEIISREFIKSGTGGVDLDAPKGMAIVGDTLYVTDISNVRAYDKKTGENVLDIDLTHRGARSLNDITADNKGTLYVSDMTGSIIFKIDTNAGNEVSEYFRGEGLKQPNGLTIDPASGDLIIATWGGRILALDKEGNLASYVDKEFKTLDGIDFDNAGNLYVSSFQLGEIYKITPDKKVSTIKKDCESPADISVDRKNKLLLIPDMGADNIETLNLVE